MKPYLSEGLSLAAYKQVLHRYPDDIRAGVGLAAAYSLLGRKEEANAYTSQKQ